MPTTFRLFVRIVSTGLLCAFLGNVTCVTKLHAATEDKAPELSDKVSTGVSGLQPLFEKKDWPGALTMIDGFLAVSGPKSVDRAFLLQLKVQVLANTGDNAGAGKALEESLAIADALKLWRFKLLVISEESTLDNLGRLSLGEAQTAGYSMDEQRALFSKAYGYFRRLVDSAKHPTIEQLTMLAQTLYYQATVDPAKVDVTLMKKAAAQMEDALLTAINPKEDQYNMLLACHQQLGDMRKASELLELMVAKFPNNKTTWSSLFNSYLAQQEQDLRAILTLERAQALGQMKSPKENFQLAALHYNTQQFSRAAELLRTGLASGEIESDQKNWELYADCYQRLGREDDSISVFKEAAKKFPKVGNFDLQIGNIFYNRDNQKEALTYMKSAVSKQLERNQQAQTYYFIAFISLDMRLLDEAKAAAEKAVQLDPRNRSFKDLLDVINKTIQEREAFKTSRA